MSGGDGYTTIWKYLMLHCTLKNSKNGQIYIQCILPQLKK